MKLDPLLKKRHALIAERKSSQKNINRQLGLPAEAKTILYTGHQFPLSFAYSNLLAEVFLELKKKYSWENIYLVIKPHPLEWKFLYYFTNQFRHHPQIKIVKNFEIYPAIISSEALVTNFSFTAIEAALLKRPVILLDFLHNHQLSIYDQPNFFKVDNVNQLEKIIFEVLSDKLKIADQNSLDNFFK